MNEEAYMGSLYQKFPVTLQKGRGCIVWDDAGKEYIDMMGGYGTALVGHCNPRVVKAIRDQTERIITVHSSLYNDTRLRYLDMLSGVAPSGLDRIHFSNSGAESVETAIKMARRFTGKKGMVAMRGSYHGKSMGALSITFNPRYRRNFMPLLDGASFVKFGDTSALQNAIDSDTGMIIVEPIQGESGIHMPPDGFLAEVREICDSKGIVLVFDEIQTGMGRTGSLWAGSHWNTTPDIVCIAKGMAGGVPMGATLTRADILDSLSRGEHSSTFGGNPLSCAAAIATLQALTEDGLVDNAKTVGRDLFSGLERLKECHPIIREVRGLGLMVGVELRFVVRDILHDLINRGVLMLYSGKTILRMLPPLVISKGHVDDILEQLDAALTVEEKKRNVQVAAK